MSDEQPIDPLARSRRALLAGAGAVGATVVLAACGGDDSGNDGSANPTTGATDPGTEPGTDPTEEPEDPATPEAIAQTSEIPVGGGKIFATDGIVITQPAAGTFKGFTSTCTHQNCPVANVDGGTINCTCHGSQYSIQDGSVKRGPATRALRARDITVEGSSISLA